MFSIFFYLGFWDLPDPGGPEIMYYWNCDIFRKKFGIHRNRQGLDKSILHNLWTIPSTVIVWWKYPCKNLPKIKKRKKKTSVKLLDKWRLNIKSTWELTPSTSFKIIAGIKMNSEISASIHIHLASLNIERRKIVLRNDIFLFVIWLYHLICITSFMFEYLTWFVGW